MIGNYSTVLQMASPLNLVSPGEGFLNAELACPSSMFPGRKTLEPFGGAMECAEGSDAVAADLATACDINAAGFFITRLPIRLHARMRGGRS